jgi:hypothetical protein
MVGAEGIEPSTSSASRKHSSTELRAYSFKPIYIKYLDSMCQLSIDLGKHLYFPDKEKVRQPDFQINYHGNTDASHLLPTLSFSRTYEDSDKLISPNSNFSHRDLGREIALD